MASITSLSNSSYNTSSIYGNRNVLSGLASGMDTESMIENAVSGIKMKIQNLIKKRTKVEWQQEAFRSIIDKAVNLNTKYTSYTSKTNLLSSSFFNNAVITTAKGTYADKVSASGKTSSDIKINAVKQLATAASYTVSGLGGLFGGVGGAITGEDFDITAGKTVSAISGQLTIEYGGSNGTSFNLDFDEMDIYDNAEDLAQAIREKLSEQKFGDSTGDELIKVDVDGSGNITFSNKTSDGNSVYISSAIGDIKDTLGVDTGEGKNTIKVGSDTKLTKTVRTTAEYLYGKTLGVTFNGTTKTINLSNISNKMQNEIKNLNSGTLTDDERKAKVEEINGKFKDLLQEELDKNFGAGKIGVSYDGGKLSFTPNSEGDTLSLGGTAIGTLGIENGASNYINTSKTLKDLLGDDFDWESHQTEDKDGEAVYDFEINGAHISITKDTTLESLMTSINSNADAGVKVSYSALTNEFKFTASETGANSKVEFGGLAKAIFGPFGSSKDSFANDYDLGVEEGQKKWVHFEANGKEFASFTIGEGGLLPGDATIDDIIKEMNDNPMRYKASYDERSGQITVTDRDGNTMNLTVYTSSDRAGEENVKAVQSKSASSYTAGQDAVMDVEINGKRFENLSRSTNNFGIDGLNITVKGTFDAKSVEAGKDYEPVTFETNTDTDKIIDTIRDFVNDYNEMVAELKSAYSTQPAYKSGTTRYEPLSAEEEAGYTESQLAAYNEKAKQGILFGDTTLSSMYSKLLNAIAPGGSDGQTLREIGIGTSYSDGLTTLSLDEDKLRATLESNPDKVKDAFTKTIEGGSSSNGLMQNLQNTLNTYVKTTGEPKGVLITKAGSIKAPTSLNNNSLKSQIDSFDKQIARWENKMADQIDRYTTQFSRLEQLIASMNSQASAFAGLMGGDSGY